AAGLGRAIAVRAPGRPCRRGLHAVLERDEHLQDAAAPLRLHRRAVCAGGAAVAHRLAPGGQAMMRARLLTGADFDALRLLRLRGLREHPIDFGADHDDEAAFSKERWRERLLEVGWFGVEEDSVLVACAFLRQPEGKKLRHNGWLNAMY